MKAAAESRKKTVKTKNLFGFSGEAAFLGIDFPARFESALNLDFVLKPASVSGDSLENILHLTLSNNRNGQKAATTFISCSVEHLGPALQPL